jgi:hypothetical protein
MQLAEVAPPHDKLGYPPRKFFVYSHSPAGAVWAQSAPVSPGFARRRTSLPDLPDETVVAIFGDGTKCDGRIQEYLCRNASGQPADGVA